MKKIDLHPIPKQAVQINKPVVLIIAALLAFVFLWAIINAFTTAPTKTSDTKNHAVIDKTTQTSAIIKDIPENYNDMNAVAKYSGLQSNNMSDVEKELASLKAEHAALEQQLMALSQSKPVVSVAENADNSQARSSGLFFSGIGSDQGIMTGMGGGMIQNVPPQPGVSDAQGKPNVPATPQQAAFFAQQNQNMQKLAVMKAADNPEDIYDLHNMVSLASPYEIQAGTVIPAVLISGINTTLSGTVVAQVRQSVFDTVTGKFLLVPKGSKLLGEYESRVAAGQRRVLISFNRVIRPDGTSILLGKPGSADLQGASGNEGDVDNHWARILGAATISTILSVGSGVAADNTGGSGNSNFVGARQGAILGASGGISGAGQSIVNRSLDIQPTITLPAGYEFNVIVKKDMVLEPYKNNEK